MEEITVYKLKDMNLKGATAINGLPSAGLVSAITANYLIGALELDQIAALDSPAFPAISMIYNAKPKLPARIYADEKAKIVVFISEFSPLPYLIRPLAYTIFDFIEQKKCSRIIAPEMMPIHDGDMEVYGVGSTDNARATMQKSQIKPIVHGIIAGIPGVLLNEGRRRNFDVITLIAQARQELSNARAAAMLIEKISKIADISIDTVPLNRESERIEKWIKNLREQSKTAAKSQDHLNMYG